MKVNFPNAVKLPGIASIEGELLKLLEGTLRPIKPEEAYRSLADTFGLDQVQLHARRRTRYESAWHNRVQTARKRLVDRGLLNGSQRGWWSATAAGKTEAENLKRILAITARDFD